MAQRTTEWQVFKYFLRRSWGGWAFLYMFFIPLGILAIYYGSIVGMEMMAFFNLVFLPALILVTYWFKRGFMRMMLESEPMIKELQDVVLKALDESPLNPANRKG